MRYSYNIFGIRLTKAEKEYVICPYCGAGYNTDMTMASILLKSPYYKDVTRWNTRMICRICRKEFWVSGSYDKVFGQPKPR